MEHLKLIRQILTEKGIDFKEIHHAPTHTSEESAAVRGEELKTGGKAIVMKLDDHFKLFVIAADRKIDSSKIKKYFGIRKLRFASSDELMSVTGLVPGSVPPFGKPVLDLNLFIDNSIQQNKKIAFNAGSLTDSIVMEVTDYLKLSGGIVFDFSD
jgi:prolyl-tRNA editing enzyme YbaK/EbsC (Cys-tRNA(Pro) deacylase)